MSNNRISLKTVAALFTAAAGSAVAAVALGTAGYFRYLNRPERYSPLPTDIENVRLIAHRGMSSLAPENTAVAFELAGQKGFWGAECDIYRTIDGRWLLSHDPNTFRMMNKPARIERKPYDYLAALNFRRGSEIEKYPDLKICTLEEYLDICKKYDMAAVIEIKGKNNSEYYSEVVSAVEERGVNAVYISFHFEDLEKIRELTNAPLYLLVKEFKREHIELVKTLENCGIDFYAGKAFGLNYAYVTQCVEEGVNVIAWTVNETQLLEKMAELGVKQITTDRIYPEKKTDEK